MSDIKKELFNSISSHIESENIENYFNYLTQLQKEQSPWLAKELVEISVFQSFAKYYDDQKMDFMICKFMENTFIDSLEKTAA